MKEGLPIRQEDSLERTRVLEQLAERIANIEKPHPVRTGIDGIETSGKTTLADTLVFHVESRGRQIIRASVDAFHAPRSKRYRQGRESAQGYYEDSFNYDQVQELLLFPLGPNGNRMYRRAVFDWATDATINDPEEISTDNAILLFDGIFLLRPELVNSWDYHIFVHIDFDVALERALKRDMQSFGSAEDIQRLYSRRYHPAQRFYLENFQPDRKANVIVYNNDPTRPKIIFSTQVKACGINKE